MATADEVESYNPWALAGLVECAGPDSAESAGARFLLSVRDDVLERFRAGPLDDEAVHEIADGAPSVYGYTRWQEFVDLAAWQETPESGDAWPSDLTEAAGVALYQIADRLAHALAAELAETEGETDDED